MDPIQSWTELDAVMGQMRTLTAQRDGLAAKHDERIQRAQAAKAAVCQPIEAKLTELDQAATAFVADHLADLTGKVRSRKLVNGTAGVRMGAAKLTLNLKPDHVERLLKQRGHLHCLTTRTDLDKDACKELPATELAACGMSIEKSETVYVKLAVSEIVQYPDLPGEDAG